MDELGFVASWRNKPAVRVVGSLFKTFAEPEKACACFEEARGRESVFRAAYWPPAARFIVRMQNCY